MEVLILEVNSYLEVSKVPDIDILFKKLAVQVDVRPSLGSQLCFELCNVSFHSCHIYVTWRRKELCGRF